MLDMKHYTTERLSVALQGNAVFSLICALLILIAHDAVLSWLGNDALHIRWLGFGLLAFAAYLVWMSRSEHLPRTLVAGVIAGD